MNRAFTLIEVLVSVAVLAILLAISVPAVRGAKQQAERAACFASLRSAMQLHTTASAGNGGYWATLLRPGEQPHHKLRSGFTVATGCYAESITQNAHYWQYALGNAVTGGMESAFNDGVACPVMVQYFDAGLMGPGSLTGDWRTSYPGQAAVFSYRYSLALSTKAELWDPDEPVNRTDPDAFRKRVGFHEVKHPSAKVAMYEPGDWHGPDGANAAPSGTTGAREGCCANVAFCDGHVERVAIRDALKPVKAPWWDSQAGSDGRYEAIGGRGEYFSSASWGYRGRDF